MSDKTQDSELKLAAPVDETHGAAADTRAPGAMPSLLPQVARKLITAALIAFIGFFAWATFDTTQQLRSDLVAKQAAVSMVTAETIALNKKIKKLTAENLGNLAELQKAQVEADAAKADADAARRSIDAVPARLAQMEAVLAQKKAEAAAAKADAVAAGNLLDSVPATIAQKQASVTQLESDLKKTAKKLSENFSSLRASAEMHSDQSAVRTDKALDDAQRQGNKVPAERPGEKAPDDAQPTEKEQ